MVDVVVAGACVLALALFAAVAGWLRTPSPSLDFASAPRRAVTQSNVYYSNCNAARAAGVAPIARGMPGYRAALDRDDDGWACEPYPR